MSPEVSPGNVGLIDESDPRRVALAQVLASRQFRQSKRLCAFLQYVTEKAIAGRPEEATEQPIGIEVFGRVPGYNPAQDNIVRSTARQVRERLSLYYHQEGAQDEWRIVLTAGKYLPRFEPKPKAVPPEPSDTLSLAAAVTIPVDAPAGTPSRWRHPSALLAAAAILTALALGLAGLAFAFRSSPAPLPNPVWATLLDSSKRLILVSGDSGSVLWQNLSGSELHVKDYAARSFPAASVVRPSVDAATLQDIGGRRYTSYSDLRFAVKLAMLPQGLPRDRFTMRFARDFSVEEMKGVNVILVGAPQGNPWVELFDKDLNFRIVSDEKRRTLTVLNRNPEPGEQAEYRYSALDANRRAFALISLTPNLDNTGHVLLVQGTTVAGIEAATDLLFNDQAIAEVLQAAPGSRLRNLEILLEAAFIAGSGGRAEVRAKRLGWSEPPSHAAAWTAP
jgi:hypothetical protein